MIIVSDSTKQFIRTPKGTTARKVVLKMYSAEIDAPYVSFIYPLALTDANRYHSRYETAESSAQCAAVTLAGFILSHVHSFTS